MDNIEILEDLITEGENLGPTISFVKLPGEKLVRRHDVFRTNKPNEYQGWIFSVKRYVRSNYSSELNELEAACKEISPDSHRNILGILNAIKKFPNEQKNKTEETPHLITINNNQNNTQNNTQKVVFNLIVESIKDEITGKDLKELKEILKKFESEPTETKPKLVDKIKGFGSDILSNIVANILTNPSIYSELVK